MVSDRSVIFPQPANRSCRLAFAPGLVHRPCRRRDLHLICSPRCKGDIMGLLVDGVWKDEWYDTRASKGRFVRTQTRFRNWITPDGAPGPTGEGGFAAQAGRYHLYLSLACPWAPRTI